MICRSVLISQVQITKMGLAEKNPKGKRRRDLSQRGIKLMSMAKMEKRELFIGWYYHWLGYTKHLVDLSAKEWLYIAERKAKIRQQTII